MDILDNQWLAVGLWGLGSAQMQQQFPRSPGRLVHPHDLQKIFILILHAAAYQRFIFIFQINA